MKFCVIGPTYPYRGGIAHYTTLLVHHLRQRHEVCFYSYRRQYPRWLFPGNTAPDPSDYALYEPCERAVDTLNPFTWWRTAQRIVMDRPDILLLQWWTPFWLPLLLVVSTTARRAGIPILYFCHQFIEPDSSIGEWFLARFALRLSDGLIVLTEEEFVMARRAFPGKAIRVGYLPICDGFPRRNISRMEARQRLGIDPTEPLLLFFGFVRRYKGLRYLLEALARLPRPIRLLIAGEFWEEEQAYRDLIRELGLEARVTIHNRYIPNEEVELYFVAADALVLPYLTGSQSAVGMTALQFGLPLIATAVGGLSETLTYVETGLIVPPGDSVALAAAVEQFFSEGLGDTFRANMARARERFSWEALIRTIEEISGEISGKRSFKCSSRPAAANGLSIGDHPGIQ